LEKKNNLIYVKMVKVLRYSLDNIFILKSKCEWKNNLFGTFNLDFKKQHNYNKKNFVGMQDFLMIP
jgi:hypothetical protein